MDHEKAFSLFKRLRKRLVFICGNVCRRLFLFGDGVKRIYQGRRMGTKAAEKGNSNAMNSLGALTYGGQGKNFIKAA